MYVALHRPHQNFPGYRSLTVWNGGIDDFRGFFHGRGGHDQLGQKKSTCFKKIAYLIDAGDKTVVHQVQRIYACVDPLFGGVNGFVNITFQNGFHGFLVNYFRHVRFLSSTG